MELLESTLSTEAPSFTDEEDPQCYQVESKYDDHIDWEALTANFTLESVTKETCNCTHPLHLFVDVCMEGCADFIPVPELSFDELAEVVMPAVLYLVVFLVGTIGNALVIFVVNRFRRMRNVTNVFLASLSTADICLIWFCVPIMFVKYMSHSWFMGRFACYSVHYIQQFTCFCSVLTMTMISFERFLAIAYPMRNIWLSSIGRAKKVILLIWLMAAVLAIPTAMRIDYETNKSVGGQRVHWCRRQFPSNLFGYSRSTLNQAYALYQLFLLIIFPVVTMSVCYARVSLIVYSSSKNRMMLSHAMVAFSKAATDACTFTSYSTLPIASSRPLQSANTTINLHNNLQKKNNRVQEANKKQIVQMLISIVVMYTVCWLPTIVDELLTSFGHICRTSNTSSLKLLRLGFHALTYCQSCINPIIYAFISQNFRATFKTAYSRMKHRLQGTEEIRSRIGSYSSASVLSTRNHHRIGRASSSRGGHSLHVPGGRSFITPNMSRDVSQLSLCPPRSPCPGGIQPDGHSSFIRPRSPTEGGVRPRSPTDASLHSRPRSSMRPRSPTETSNSSLTRPRSPTTLSHMSAKSTKSNPDRTLLCVSDAMRPRTPECK